jgi:hypothetical protein
MLDPRIYRMGLTAVVLAVIVLAFSLEDQQSALTTNLAPDAFSGQNAYATMASLARAHPNRRPGSDGDVRASEYVASKLREDGFSVSTDTYSAPTPDGTRLLQNVVGMRAGLATGTIAVVAHRDALRAPAEADMSGTSVLLELGRLLAGQTQQHTIVLASTSGSPGAAGAAELARRLPQPVDAVIVLGDMAGTSLREPVVVPWSSGQRVAPPVLRNTLATALHAQTGLSGTQNGLGGQIAHLAFPMAASEQVPFGSHGEPAVLLSLSGERGPAATEPTSLGRITGMGRSVVQALSALDGGPKIAAPSSYLEWAGKAIPAWAVRLFVLALILPVLATTVDGVARARRRGHPVARWTGWVLAGGLPFVAAGALVLLFHAVGLIASPPGAPVGGDTVPLGASGVVLLALIACVLVGVIAWLGPRTLRAASRAGAPGSERAGAGTAVLSVLCVVALAVWFANPFAAALLIPALHSWLWIVEPDLRLRAPAVIVLLLVGLAIPGLVVFYYASTLGVGPVGLAWSWSLLLAGGAVGWFQALEWSILAGCAMRVIAISVRGARTHRDDVTEVTIRGPVTYAGPGSLGGTESALRR